MAHRASPCVALSPGRLRRSNRLTNRQDLSDRCYPGQACPMQSIGNVALVHHPPVCKIGQSYRQAAEQVIACVQFTSLNIPSVCTQLHIKSWHAKTTRLVQLLRPRTDCATAFQELGDCFRKSVNKMYKIFEDFMA